VALRRRMALTLAVLCGFALAAAWAPAGAQAAGEVVPIDLQCGYEPDTNTFRPIATVRRDVDTGDNTVGVQLILLDGTTQLATLGTGEVGAENNGTGEVPLGEELDFTPNLDAYFGDGNVGGPALTPKTYTIRVRVTDFGTFGVTFGDFSCSAGATCSGVTPHTVDEQMPDDAVNPSRPPLSLFQGESLIEDRAADDAACEAVWVPTVLPPAEANRDFVPQGLALRGDGTALVSGYMAEIKKDPNATCRIVGVDLETGAELGVYNFPDGHRCAHAGGIAIDDDGRIWVADTKYLIMFRRSHLLFSPTESPRPVVRRIGLDAEGDKVPGSYLVDGAPGHLWIGTYQKTSDGTLYEFAIEDLLEFFAPGGTAITFDAATPTETVPPQTQGAAFRGSVIWSAQSASTWGELTVGSAGGRPFGPGVEEIEVADGCLWATFEAGAKIYPRRSYPVVARFDPKMITGQGSTPACAP
jgi:hypothetical protein